MNDESDNRGMRTLGIGALLGALTAFFLDPTVGRRRRARGVDRVRGTVNRGLRRTQRTARGVGATAYGVLQRLTHLREQPKDYDDATLAHKVETEIFRPADVPKGKIVVNAVDGIVQLRGEADTPELMDELVERTRRVQGVREVENLLHLPNTEAPMHR